MTESLISEWLDENRFRAFPLSENVQRISGSFRLPDDCILDAYFYLTEDTPVYLNSVERTPSNIIVTTNVGVFTTNYPIPEDGITVTLSSGSKITLGVGMNDTFDGNVSFYGVEFESSVCIYYNNPWRGVSSLTLNDLTLVDAVNVFPGVQTYLGVKGEDVLIWSVGRNQGTPPDNCLIYGNLPDDCGTQISYVNGVTSNANKQLSLSAGNGLRITPDVDGHTLSVGFTFDVSNICPPIPPTA